MLLGNRLFFIFVFSYRLLLSKHGTFRRTLIQRTHPLYAEGSLNGNSINFIETVSNSDKETAIDSESLRLAEWEKRKRKEIICKSMPKSQKWYKEKQQHVSPNQKRIYNEYWPIYGVDLKYGNNVIPQQLFPNITVSDLTPVCLDIGFGLGDSIVGNISSLGIENVRVIKADVTLLLGTYLKGRCLDEVCIFFPDPWPNTERDGERRVVRKDIIDLISRSMRPGGQLYIATDVQEYADHVRSVMKESEGWKLNNEIDHLPCINGPSYRPITKYEKKAVDLSNRIWDFEYQFN